MQLQAPHKSTHVQLHVYSKDYVYAEGGANERPQKMFPRTLMVPSSSNADKQKVETTLKICKT